MFILIRSMEEKGYYTSNRLHICCSCGNAEKVEGTGNQESVWQRKICVCFRMGECQSMMQEWSRRQCLKTVKNFPRTCQ